MLTTTLPLLLCKFYLQTLSKRNILVFCAAGLVSDAIMCNHNATLGVKWIAAILQNLDWSYVRNIIQLFEPVQRPHPLFVQGEDCRVAISLLWIEKTLCPLIQRWTIAYCREKPCCTRQWLCASRIFPPNYLCAGGVSQNIMVLKAWVHLINPNCIDHKPFFFNKKVHNPWRSSYII